MPTQPPRRTLTTARAVLRVLTHLARAPDGLSTEQVAEVVGTSRATATYLLTSLCFEGFATRDAAEGRYRLIDAQPTSVGQVHHQGACAVPPMITGEADARAVGKASLAHSRAGAAAYRDTHGLTAPRTDPTREGTTVYEHDGARYYVVDGHIHNWKAGPDNRNRWGEGFIKCFHDYHANLSPEEYVWSLEEFEEYSPERLVHDLFEIGYVDRAIFQPTYLTEFFPGGFNTTEQDAEVAEAYPGRFVLNTSFDPRDEEAGLRAFEEKVERYGSTGVKLYTAEWRGDSKGWTLRDPWARKYLEKAQELGVRNIHVHKGPTIWPLNKDAFNVDDVDDAATMYPQLNFIVEHVGLPRLEDFCWIGVQEPNVYGGLAVAIPFIHTRPRYFATVLGELLYWLGEDRILFASDYAIWQPKWLVERFVEFEMPEDLVPEYGEVTTDMKRKILGLNAATLYDLEVPDDLRLPADEGTGMDVSDKPAVDTTA